MMEQTSVQSFVDVMRGTQPGMPFSENVNRECAAFMKRNAAYLKSTPEISDNNMITALLHASSPRFPYVVPALHALSKVPSLNSIHSSSNSMLPFSKAWFFAFSSIDKDQLIAAYVELIEKFDLAVLLPTESDVTLFVQVLTNYAEEMNALLVSTIKKFNNHIPSHTHQTVDKEGTPAQPMLTNSVGSVVKDSSEPITDFTESIDKAKALVTAPRALCHVIKTIRAKYSQLSVTVPPHTHNWYSESNKKEFAVQKLVKDIQVGSVTPHKKGDEPQYDLVPIWKLRQEMTNWTPGTLLDHTHLILSGSTPKSHVIVGIASTFAIGKVKYN